MSTPTDRQTVANARRDVHELLVTLPAWDADQVRDRITVLEQAVRSQALAEAAHPSAVPPFVPPAASDLPEGALDSATVGACALDGRARTDYGRNVLAHALVQLQRDGWLPSRTVPSSELRDRIAAALRDAAYDCDGNCGLDERECDAQHPIQAAVLHFGIVSDVTGDVHALADAVLATVQPELDRLRVELEQARQQLPTDITIHTRKPGKWRFVDTETGQVWAWDDQRNTFKLADDATQPSA